MKIESRRLRRACTHTRAHTQKRGSKVVYRNKHLPRLPNVSDVGSAGKDISANWWKSHHNIFIYEFVFEGSSAITLYLSNPLLGIYRKDKHLVLWNHYQEHKEIMTWEKMMKAMELQYCHSNHKQSLSLLTYHTPNLLASFEANTLSQCESIHQQELYIILPTIS